jgi:hypothetical protein
MDYVPPAQVLDPGAQAAASADGTKMSAKQTTT